MKTSRTKFIILFLAFAFTFLIFSNSVLDQQPESFFGSTTQAAWQSAVSVVLSPVKMILMGPLLPFINFLRQDPDTPPPFYLLGFAIYWIILGASMHYLAGRLKMRRPGTPA